MEQRGINTLAQSTLLDKLSIEAIEDLRKSGLENKIIIEAKILPATKTNLDKYKIHWFDKIKRQERFKPLYIIPYQILGTDKEKFCRVKVKPLPEYPDFTGKYTQPPKQVLKDACHLYILPSELERLKSSRCKIAIVEGEKKALKLIQEIRKLEDYLGYKIAVIGISGINNWQSSPEWKLIKLIGKDIILFFDADSEYNKAVVGAELELAGFLYSKGAGNVKSAVWSINEGKGIDDFLVSAEDKQLDKLKGLLDSLISVFEKYKKNLQDKELLRTFFKYPVMSEKERIEYLTDIVKSETGVAKTRIERVIKVLRVEFEEELKEKLEKQIKEAFGAANIKIPNGFLWEEGYLKDNKGNIITYFFIVKNKIHNENNEQVGITLKFVNGKEIFLLTEDLNKKHITYIFNKNSIGMDEQTAVKVLNYITQYQNVNNIKVEKKAFSIGWIEDKYYLPQIEQEIEFEEELSKEFQSKGNKEKEFELMNKVFNEGKHLALGYIFGFASTLIKPLEISNFVIFNQGLSGKGKTTTNLLGLSLFGKYNKIKRNLNTTEVGLEIYLSDRKDTLILLDEVNTGKRDVVNQLVKIIYDFENGKGRTRANKNLGIRQVSEYRGILSISSEDSLKHLLEQTNKTTKGALRRALIIDFSEFENIDNEFFELVYLEIKKNYGNLIKDWIEFVKNNIEDIEKLYFRWINELRNEDKGFKFKGQEYHLAVLFATAEIVNKIFKINTEEVFNILWELAEYNHFEFAEVIELTPDKLEKKLDDFVSKNINKFVVEIQDRNGNYKEVIPRELYGKIVEDTIFFTGYGLKELSKYLTIPEKELKKILVKFHFAEKDENRTIKRTSIQALGQRYNVYPISKIPNSGLEFPI